ncbi:MAG TPA: ATP-binding protein [Phycisphaerae bacterium]|nr:ATP-binding protein [Phycisphaerae bacterium]
MTTATTRPTYAPPVRRVAFGVIEAQGHRVGVFGPGGIGKTTLAATAPGPVGFIDLDDSLPILRPSLGELDIRRVSGVAGWQDIRDALHSDGWDGVRTIVIDSATKAEELALEWTLRNVRHEKDGVVIRRIEDYGFGKGYQHLYETFLTLLNDLDQHVRAGRNVILICHDCTATVPNPKGEDYIRWEPRLQNPSSGKASIRLRVREWLDHLLYVGYDVESTKSRKAQGHGTRTIYPQEMPWCMAKSRTLAEPVELVQFDTTLWNKLLAHEAE